MKVDQMCADYFQNCITVFVRGIEVCKIEEEVKEDKGLKENWQEEEKVGISTNVGVAFRIVHDHKGEA